MIFFIFFFSQVQFIIVTAHIGQIYIMDDCPYQYPIFMFIIWLYGSMFLVLFLHFWYHAYTKGQRPPKMTRNGISKDQWKKKNLLPTKKKYMLKLKLALLDNQDNWVHTLHCVYFVCFLPKPTLYFCHKLFGFQNLGGRWGQCGFD